MPTTVDGLFELLLDVSIKAVLLASIAGGLLFLLRIRNANLLHRVWSAVLVAMVALPFLVYLVPHVRVPIAKRAAAIVAKRDTVGPAPIETMPMQHLPETATTANKFVDPIVAPAPALSDNAARPAEESRPLSTDGPQIRLPPFLLAVYLVGIVWFGLRLFVGIRHARQLVRLSNATALPPNQQRAVGTTRVRESALVRVPLTVGCWRPTIVLPDDWRAWDESMLRAVLCHEQEHVRRGDPWTILLAELNRAIYWFHPVAWFLRRRLSMLAEAACDDAVIASSGDRSGYARHLLTVAGRLTEKGRRLAPAGVAMARTPQVERRINAVLDSNRPLARRLSILAALVLAAVSTSLGLLVAGLEANDDKAHVENSSKPPAASSGASASGTSGEPEIYQVRGRVVMQSDGKPVADADVRLVTWTNGGTRYTVKRVRSNQDGEFTFDGISKGKHRLVAFYEDFASRQSMYKGDEVDLDSKEPTTLKLQKMPRIAVRVVSKADDKPIADATVRLVWTDTERDNKTDAAGRVLLRHLTHEVWHVNVRAKGFAVQEQIVNLAGTDTANLKFALDPAGSLSGTVKDEAGNALKDAGISVFPADFHGPQIEYLKTDAEGRYRFDNLPLEQGFQLIVSKSGYVEVRPDISLGASGGKQRELNLTLKRKPHGGSVRGQVTDANGEPVQRATVINEGGSTRDIRKVTTGADGRYLLDDVFEQRLAGHELIVKAKGYAPQRIRFKPGTKDQPAELNIKLEPGHHIRGRVVDDAGHPITGVSIYTSDGNHSPKFQFGSRAITGKDGSFEFDSLPSDAPFTFEATSYSEIANKTLPLDGDEEVIVTMKSEGMIRGKVIDAATRKPITAFNIEVTFSPDRLPSEPAHSLSGPRATQPDGERFTNSEGAFVLKQFVREMPLQLTVKADGYERQVYRRIVATAKPEPIVVPLLPIDASKLITVAGRLVDSLGKPIAGAEVRLITALKASPRYGTPGMRSSIDYPFNWQMIQRSNLDSREGVSQFLSTLSGRNGEFKFERVIPAPFMEVAYWGKGVPRGRREQLENLSDDERKDLTIEVPAPGVVRGKIDRKAFPEARSVMLHFTDPRMGFDYQEAPLTADQNEYEIRDLPPGKYELQVYAYTRGKDDSYNSKVLLRRPLEIHAGEEQTIDLPGDDK
jgi:beta-lactamase regulating signal transducer with metallopeptidase domain/protocatechuate 3,4-dioxygenase beta subunit